MILTGLSDYLNELKLDVHDDIYDPYIFMAKSIKRNNFIRQNLSEPYIIDGVKCHPLNRFVETDLEGNVLEKPKFYDNFKTYTVGQLTNRKKEWYDACHKFEQSEQRVLFKGCHSIKFKEIYQIVSSDYNSIWRPNINKTIEDLCILGLELTETGIKEAGL